MRIGMDLRRHMLWREDAKVKYSAAYSTGREHGGTRAPFTMGSDPIVKEKEKGQKGVR